MAENNPASEIASVLQSASINHHPDVRFDANPSTSASRKTPVRVVDNASSNTQSTRTVNIRESAQDAIDDDSIDDDGTNAIPEEIPLSILEAPLRKQNLPPLPDLRFEQSYLARIQHCQDWKGVAWVTFFDHVFMPLTQGVVWNLLLHGWRAGNQGAKFSGHGVGARIRRWWWGVNNWTLPEEAKEKRM